VTSLTWPDDPAAYETYGMPREKLMDIVLPGTVYGGVTKAAAEATGLPEGLPVVAGAGDKQCEVLGAGAIGTGEVYVSYGTLACVNTFCYTEQAPTPRGGEYYTMGAAVPGGWNLEASLRGHLMVSWLPGGYRLWIAHAPRRFRQGHRQAHRGGDGRRWREQE
jgi:sugar (pentulose or hexulose) kinase